MPFNLRVISHQSLSQDVVGTAPSVAPVRRPSFPHPSHAVLHRYPDYPLQMLVEMNIDGVARELAAELASAR
jgi:hypothetical protein